MGRGLGSGSGVRPFPYRERPRSQTREPGRSRPEHVLSRNPAGNALAGSRGHRDHPEGPRREGRRGQGSTRQGCPEEATGLSLLRPGASRPAGDRLRPGAAHQDVLDAGLLHPIRVDGAHAERGRQGAGEQGSLSPASAPPRGHHRVRRSQPRAPAPPQSRLRVLALADRRPGRGHQPREGLHQAGGGPAR